MSLLLVDDNSFFLRIATRFLAGFPELELMGSASTADEALAKAGELQPDVILLDINMHNTSGLDIITRLRAMLPAVKIIVLTLWDTEMYRQAALAAGADDFVPKSVINSHLVPAIHRVTTPPTTAG